MHKKAVRLTADSFLFLRVLTFLNHGASAFGAGQFNFTATLWHTQGLTAAFTLEKPVIFALFQHFHLVLHFSCNGYKPTEEPSVFFAARFKVFG